MHSLLSFIMVNLIETLIHSLRDMQITDAVKDQDSCKWLAWLNYGTLSYKSVFCCYIQRAGIYLFI